MSRTPETRAKIAATLRGQRLSEEHRERIAEAYDRRAAWIEAEVESHAAEYQARIAAIRALKRAACGRKISTQEMDSVLPLRS